VKTPKGIHFKLGIGFTDPQRANPPKIGSLVSYTYRNITKTGKPKFSSFLRVRNEKYIEIFDDIIWLKYVF
jgi:DNA ligase-1